MTLVQGQVDLAALTARIRAAFPDLAFEHAVLNDVGDDHAVVVLDGAWVLRFPRESQAAAYGVGERRLLAALDGTCGLAVPRYDLVAPDVAGYALIAGAELSEALFASLPQGVQERAMDQVGAFLRALHDLPLTLVEGARPPPSGLAYAYGYRKRRAALAAKLPQAVMAGVDRFYSALPESVAWPPRTLIHGDFTEDHILLAPERDGLAGVIDFTDAGPGDPAFDFTFLWAYGEQAPTRAAAVYGGRGTEGMLRRSRWWFTRYRIDQVWWSVSGAREYDVDRIAGELPALFSALGL